MKIPREKTDLGQIRLSQPSEEPALLHLGLVASRIVHTSSYFVTPFLANYDTQIVNCYIYFFFLF